MEDKDKGHWMIQQRKITSWNKIEIFDCRLRNVNGQLGFVEKGASLLTYRVSQKSKPLTKYQKTCQWY